MKKILASLLGAGLLFSMSSCNDDIEIWDSAVLDYSGSYVVQVQEEDGTVLSDYKDDNKIDIYNTSDDVPNEFWITDYGKYLEITSKFFLTGDASNFASKSLEFDDLPLNISVVIEDFTPKPTVAGETVTKNIWGAKTALVEGKILPKAMTTIGGNVADSIYMKIKFMYGDVTFKSVEVPVEYRADPEVAEFKWKIESSAYDAASGDETYVYSGYRYTGFPEDQH
ncbi:MAG: hypothetical protein JXR82_16085 [Marinifilaceae bacterium]|nr:hypothetical protein [Marinifilaceae bacterium]